MAIPDSEFMIDKKSMHGQEDCESFDMLCMNKLTSESH